MDKSPCALRFLRLRAHGDLPTTSGKGRPEGGATRRETRAKGAVKERRRKGPGAAESSAPVPVPSLFEAPQAARVRFAGAAKVLSFSAPEAILQESREGGPG